jgi:hypothetical protein
VTQPPLERLLAAAARRDRPADLVWPAAAAIELLWWHDRFDDAQHLAETTIRDLAEQPGTLEDQRVPFADALLAAPERRRDDPLPILTAVQPHVREDSVLGKDMAWLAAQLPQRPAHELVSGFHWGQSPGPLKRRDQELADRPLTDLTDAERERLYSAAHSRHQFAIADRLLTETGHYPGRWYVAVWMAGELTHQGHTEQATALLLQALPGWIPYEAWDLVPTDIVLQPQVRPAVTDQIRAAVLRTVDITKVPGIAT